MSPAMSGCVLSLVYINQRHNSLFLVSPFLFYLLALREPAVLFDLWIFRFLDRTDSLTLPNPVLRRADLITAVLEFLALLKSGVAFLNPVFSGFLLFAGLMQKVSV